MGKGSSLGNIFWFLQTRRILLSNGANCAVLRAVVLTQYRRMSDRQTDRRTDGIAIANTALAMRALRRAVKIFVNPIPLRTWHILLLARQLQPWIQRGVLASLWTVISRCRRMSAPCVGQHTACCASYVKSCDRCRLMRQRHSSTRSSRRV